MKPLIYILCLLQLLSCKQDDLKNSVLKLTRQKEIPTRDSLIHTYEKLYRFSLHGDFNGDGKQETIFQNNINTKTGLSIDSFPSTNWETMMFYFNREINSDIFLTCKTLTKDTLHLGSGFGLYRLINLGDVNHDKTDELAIAVENADFSRINHCYIYTLKNKKWIELKSFSIHEDAFDEEYSMKAIKGFLENKKGKWYYLDYLEDMEYENEKDVGKMKELKLPK